MPDSVRDRTTELLCRLAAGDAQAQERLFPALQAELRRIAAAMMRGRAAGHTLQPTALMNEAWLRLIRDPERTFENRRHFLGVAAKAMRSVLVDHARSKRARKRGGDLKRHDLESPHELDELLFPFEQAVATLGSNGGTRSGARSGAPSSGSPSSGSPYSGSPYSGTADKADLLDLDTALTELEADDPELARLIELRFFGGMTHEEVAAALGVSLSTVERMWRMARARLHQRLSS